MGWKDSDVEKVNCRVEYIVRSNSLTNVFITQVINIESDTAVELWAGNSARLMGPIIKEKL